MSVAAPTSDARKTACSELLLGLGRLGRAERRATGLALGMLATVNDMSLAYPPGDDRAIATRLGPDVADFGDTTWIHGPSTPSFDGGPGTLPAVSVRWDWTGDIKIRLVVVLIRIGSTAAKGLDAVAYRFEQPDPRAGAHDYWHAQPTNRLARMAASNLPALDRPLDTSVPAFPVDAHGPVGLTVAMLLSLYGARRLKGELLQTRQIRDAVAPHRTEAPLWSARL